MSNALLIWIVLVEGFVTVSAEILTIRQLLPVVGNSVIVTSLIIGIFLLFLAYGYRRGGQYEASYKEILKQNFTKSAVLLGIGLSYFFIWFFFNLSRYAVTKSTFLTLSLYLLLVTAPLVYILGQTVPITMNLIKKVFRAGAIGGKILHLSTIGSFLGSVATSLLLMNYLGVAWTIFINCAGLSVLVWILSEKKREDIIRSIVLIFVLIVVYALNVSVENKTLALANAYANYEVQALNNGKVLIINGSSSSFVGPQKQGFPYIELIKRILFEDLNLTNKNILVLGAGGFSLTAEGTHNNQFTYVDIDKDIQKLVKQNFELEVPGTFVAEDARAFLNGETTTWDVIVTDVYSSFRSIPAQLLTREFFSKVYERLSLGGFAIFNVIMNPTLVDEYSFSVDKTIQSVFTRCMIIPESYNLEGTNVIYVCFKKNPTDKIPDKTPSLYTDNLNRATLDFFNSSVMRRQ